MARPSVIDKSEHKDEIYHLLVELRWGTRTVEKYLQLKHGFVVAHSTLRAWRGRLVEKMQAEGKLLDWEPPTGGNPVERIARINHPSDDVPDILQRRMALIALQQERINLDVAHELSMGKTFNTGVREIEMLNKLLSDAKTDMQDIGLWPTREGSPTVVNNIHAQAVAAAATQAAGDNQVSVDAEVLSKIGLKLLVAKNELAVDKAEEILAARDA